MPVFNQLLERYLRNVVDEPVSYNNQDMTMRIGSRILTRPLREAFMAKHEEGLASLLSSVDWNRVLLEATARHLKLEHPDAGLDGYGVMDGNVVTGMICPECLVQALLCRETFPDY